MTLAKKYNCSTKLPSNAIKCNVSDCKILRFWVWRHIVKLQFSGYVWLNYAFPLFPYHAAQIVLCKGLPSWYKPAVCVL